jgi:hypothetical protein
MTTTSAHYTRIEDVYLVPHVGTTVELLVQLDPLHKSILFLQGELAERRAKRHNPFILGSTANALYS